MENNKRQIFEAFQNHLDGLNESEEIQAELEKSAIESDLEKELVDDAQLDGTLRLQRHIESTENSFVDGVMELVNGSTPPARSTANNFTMTESRISGQDVKALPPGSNEDKALGLEDGLTEVPPSIPQPTAHIPKVVPNSVCKPVDPASQANDIPKVVPNVQPGPINVTPINVMPQRVDPNQAGGDGSGPVYVQPIQTKPPVQNSPQKQSKPVKNSNSVPPPPKATASKAHPSESVRVETAKSVGGVPTKRQYDRVNRKRSQIQMALTIAFSAILLGAISFVIVNSFSQNEHQSAGVDEKERSPNGNNELIEQPENRKKDFPGKQTRNDLASNDTGKKGLPKNEDIKNPFEEVKGLESPKMVNNLPKVNGENQADKTKEKSGTTFPKTLQEDQIFAQLVESSGAVWNSDTSSLLSDRKHTLRTGKVIFRMGNGALVTVTGPSEFQLKSDDRVELSSGLLSANVPPRAVGFTVDTPASKVVDLGTEFDVSVNEVGATGVRVRKGEVTMEPVVDSGAGKKKWSLREGDFKWIDEKGLSHDWNLTLKLDAKGQGAVHINGMTFPLSDKTSFDEAKAKILDEFQKFENEFMDRVGGDKSFRGIIDMAGTKMDFDDVKEFINARDNASKSLNGLEDIMNKFKPEEILNRGGIRSSSSGFSIGSSSISKDGFDFGGVKVGKDGIEFDGSKFPGLGKGMLPKGFAERFRIDRTGIGGRPRDKDKIKPGPNELILLISGAGREFRLRTTDGDPVSDLRQLKGSGREVTEVNVSRKQKISIYMDGAGNVAYVPTSIRKNVRTNIQGASNKVEYFTERTRFREKLRKERESGVREKSSPIKRSGIEENDKSGVTDPDKKTTRPLVGDGTIPTGKAPANKKGARPDVEPKRDDTKVGPLLIVVSGSSNKIELEVTPESAQSGIRTVHGINENATIPVGAEQHVTVYLDGIRNEAVAPVEVKVNVSGRLDGIGNRLLFRSKDGKIVGGFEMETRDQQNQYETTRKVRSGYVGARPSTDKSTLLVLIEGEKHDIIFREAKRRGDYGAKFIEGKSNEISFNVLPEQQVYVLNKARDTIIFVNENLRESVSVESKGSKNAVDYFE